MKRPRKGRQVEGTSCPYLLAVATKTCRAYRNGLKVPTRREEFEYCTAQFGLCPLYLRAQAAGWDGQELAGGGAPRAKQ